MVLGPPGDHVINDFILSIQDNISELSKVLNDILCFKLGLNKYVVRALLLNKLRILDKLLNDWVQNTIVLLVIL